MNLPADRAPERSDADPDPDPDETHPDRTHPDRADPPRADPPRAPVDRRTLDAVFGQVLPEITSDERAERDEGAGSPSDDWYYENRPPHHDR